MKTLQYKIILSIAFLLLCIQINTTAQHDSIPKRPKIGLVLSGGGAKGIAEIPTLKLIEKYDIPIDYIAGTSIGRIVGALYAIGYSAEDIEQIGTNMNWEEMFSGETKRPLVSIEEKDEEGKYLLEIPVKNGKPVIPTGLISGQRIEMELAKLTWSVHNVRDFSKLPIPYTCVAADIEKGEAVYLNKGYLPDAIRASMSVPSVMYAVEIDDKLLVDGGLINNFPVSYTKDVMGADFIIGVNVQSKLYSKKELNSMLRIMEQAASFENDRLTKEEVKKVDILVSPDITGYDAGSFDKESIDSLYLRGQRAALKQEHLFKALSDELKKYKLKRKTKIHQTNLHSIFISKIKYEGLHKVSKALIKSKLRLKDSSWVSLKDIERAVEMVYGSKYFEKVNYKLEQDSNKTNLIIKVIEQPFSMYKVGVNFNNYFNSSLLLNGTFRNILGEGSRLLLNAKLGFQPEFSADYTIFTTLKPSIGFRVNAQYYSLDETYYNFTDSLDLRIHKGNMEATLGLASSINNSIMVGAGAKIAYKIVKSQDVMISFQKPYRSSLSAYGYIKMDTYDKNIYPTEGLSFEMNATYVFGELNKTDNYYNKKYWTFFAHYNQYFPITDRLNYKQYFAGAVSLKNNLFYSDRYFLGGSINYKNYVFPLEGFRFMEIMGQNIAALGSSLRYEPWNGKFIFASANAGIAENDIVDLIQPSEIYIGGALGAGIRTVIGQVEYRISINNFNHEINHWLQIGYYF